MQEPANATRLIGNEDGSVTVWSIFWVIIFLMVGGLSVDVNNARRMQAMLQATADSAALTAAIEMKDQSAAVTEAIRVASLNMSDAKNGSVVTSSNVQFGTWDSANAVFTEGGVAPDAARVVALRTTANNNEVANFILRIGPFDSWDVAAVAIAQRFVPYCFYDGLISAQLVEMSSSNEFYNKTCVHGEQGVKLTNHNYFEGGTTVSMNNLNTLSTPSGDLTSNDGLADALAQQSLYPRLVGQLDDVIAGLLDPGSEWQPSFFDSYDAVEVINVKWKDFEPATIAKGKIYNVDCKGQPAVKLTGTITIEDVVIVTDCPISFDSDVLVTNATLATTNTGGNAISGSAGSRIGLPDNCADGGGAQLLSMGGIKFASAMEFHGAQLVAVGDVDLTAQTNGMSGTSVQAGGTIKLTSQSSFALCDSQADLEFVADYWRLVK